MKTALGLRQELEIFFPEFVIYNWTWLTVGFLS